MADRPSTRGSCIIAMTRVAITPSGAAWRPGALRPSLRDYSQRMWVRAVYSHARSRGLPEPPLADTLRIERTGGNHVSVARLAGTIRVK